VELVAPFVLVLVDTPSRRLRLAGGVSAPVAPAAGVAKLRLSEQFVFTE
jgi:hypothetical protein